MAKTRYSIAQHDWNRILELKPMDERIEIHLLKDGKPTLGCAEIMTLKDFHSVCKEAVRQFNSIYADASAPCYSLNIGVIFDDLNIQKKLEPWSWIFVEVIAT